MPSSNLSLSGIKAQLAEGGREGHRKKASQDFQEASEFKTPTDMPLRESPEIELLPIQKPDFIEAIKRCRGSLTAAADSLGLPDASLLLFWMQRDREVRLAYETARMRLVDRSEQNIFDAVEDHDLATSKFVLRTLGKERGYTERHEIDARHQHIGSPKEASTEQLVTLLQEALQMNQINKGSLDFEQLETDLDELNLIEAQ